MATAGLLQVNVKEARLTRDTEMFGKMDPYVRVTNRMQVVCTSVQQNAGKDPQWHETLDLDVKYIGDDLLFEVIDKEMVNDDMIGSASIKISSLCANGGIDEWWTIMFRGKSAGQLHLSSVWKPAAEAGAQKPAQPQAAQPQAPQAPQQVPVGYPVQPGYPQQQPMPGYPQQPQMPGYPQQQMGYPQQQMGYPQQQMGYPQQQMGYPQQQMGYPQQQMGYPQQQQQMYQQPSVQVSVQQTVQTGVQFHCPKCRRQLIADPNSKQYSDIQCDLCDKFTTKVISCRPCDYDLCYKCASKRM